MDSAPLCLIDAEYGLARDLPVAQLGADLCYVTPAVFDESRF
jgi:hypothetical protein